MITVDEVRKAVAYDPETGIFTRLDHPGMRPQARARHAGKSAGYISNDGYWRIKIGPTKFLAHRLAWVLMTGEWPTAQLDHRDLDRSNNRWNNLRLATPSQNITNSPARAASGYKGVYRNGRKWRSRVSLNGKFRYLGTFATPEQASDAYLAAAKLLYGEFARRS
jgi:hypothetical protein